MLTKEAHGNRWLARAPIARRGAVAGARLRHDPRRIDRLGVARVQSKALASYQPDYAAHQLGYLVVEMARHLLGEGWMREFVDRANRGGIERVLL